MSNVFDQFDQSPNHAASTPAAPAGTANVFDQFDPPEVETPSDTEPKQQEEKSLTDNLTSVPLEYMAGFNNAAVKLVDFLGPDQVNAVLQLAGSDMRMPTLSEQEVVQEGTKGGFMDDGLAKDAVRAAGEVSFAGVSTGAGLRHAADKLPQMVSNAESVGRGALREMAKTTAKQDAKMGAMAGVGAEVGGDVGEAVGGETGRQVGEIAGSIIAPAAGPLAKAGAAESVKSILRVDGKKGAERARKLIDDFVVIGEVPTLGTASGRESVQSIQNVSSQLVGGNPIIRARERIDSGIRHRIQRIANEISPSAGADRAGRAIQQGISGKGGFVERFQAKSSTLWSKVDEKIGADTQVALANSKERLDNLVKTNVFADILNNPKLVQVKRQMDGIDSVDYATLKELRSVIGQKISNTDLVSDIPRAELKQLYGAISSDIEMAAASAGDDAFRVFKRANRYTRSGHKRLDDFVERITKKVDLEAVFTSATKGGEGASTINAFKRSLNPDEWDVVVSNVLRRLGRATPGQQDAEGTVFSVSKFLTDWNRLGESSRKALFSGSKKLNQYQQDIEKVSRVAGAVKFAQKPSANPSGSGQFLANVGAAVATGGSFAMGNAPVFASVLTAMASNHAAARLMTSPKFVRWMAKATEVPLEAAPQHLAKLPFLAGAVELEEAVAILDLMDSNELQSFSSRMDQDDHKSQSKIDADANGAATSPLNDLPEPTDSQKQAGNYRKGRIEVNGFKIAIENPKGSVRSGTDPDGKTWESQIHHHYGDLTGTKGADGDALDVFVGEDVSSEKVFIVDQITPDGEFDEHKILMNFDNKLKARQGYLKNYEPGWKVGPITAMTLDEFREWLKGDTTKPVDESFHKAVQKKRFPGSPKKPADSANSNDNAQNN